MDKYRISIIGATTLGGQELVRILEERQFPLESLTLWTTDDTANRTISAPRRAYTVQALGHENEKDAFQETDIVFFIEGDNTSRHLVPRAVQAGALAIDSSSVFRMDEDVPLVIPEINPEDIRSHRGIIASPGCSTIIFNTAVYPLHKINPVKRAVVSTYQSVSGVGLPAMRELTEQVQRMLAGQTVRPVLFPHEIGFNVLPQVDVFLDNGYTKEEWQMLDETRKILHNDSILISTTCVRVPVYKGHCQAITLEFENEINPDIAGDTLARAVGVRVVDDPGISLYPDSRMAAGTDMVMVGRLRQDVFNTNGLVLWAAADNTRKGNALNLVQIAEKIIKEGWLKTKG